MASAVPILIAVTAVVVVVFAVYVARRPDGKGILYWFRTKRMERQIAAGNFAQAAEEYVRRGLIRQAAELLMEHGQYNRALGLLMEHKEYRIGANAAIAAGRKEDAVMLLEHAGDYAAAGKLLERDGRVKEAVKMYLKAGSVRAAAESAVRTADARVISQTADWLVRNEEAELAIPLLRRVNRYLDLGRALESVGREDEALATYESSGAFEDAARIHLSRSEHRRAAYLLLRGQKPTQAVAALVGAGDFFTAAKVHRRHGDDAAAADMLQRIDEADPQYREGLLLAATIYEEHNRFDHTISCLQRLLELEGYCSEHAETIFRLVDLHIHVGDYESAVQALELAKAAGVESKAVDEQLMLLREAPTSEVDGKDPTPKPEQVKKPGEATTTILFPRLERYDLKRKLAHGGHGVLFLVHDKTRSEDVVLKVLHSQSLPSKLARRYFLREARTASSLDHPNVVRVHEVGEYQGRLFISMEYVAGHNLLEMFESVSNPLTIDKKLHICTQLCHALDHAHSMNIVHRDIKMSNVMVNQAGQVKLTDFGLAKVLDEDPARSVLVMGTPDYMSPEQLAGDFVDARSDIFSLGVLMYRLFTENDPFEDPGVFSEERFKNPEYPTEHVPNLPPILADTIIRCLRYRREDRYQSAADAAEGLRGVIEKIRS